MEKVIFLIIFFSASIFYGIVAIINPYWAWKKGIAASNKIREPNQVDLMITRIMGLVLILILLVIIVFVVRGQLN
ncbi:hypothetical protein AB4114_29845 [Paenibacillus sp. 2RAB27]|uniref:hypothetical protein n=1 Tax=Paenibacillus sp. 2RAB27 TaxID=3232991 RepID=UPI003F9CA6AC